MIQFNFLKNEKESNSFEEVMLK